MERPLFSGKIFGRRSFVHLLAIGGAASLMKVPAARAAEPRVTIPSYNTFTDEEEIEIGRRFSADYEKHVELLSNPLINVYLNGIIRKLGDASQRPQWPYEVKVVNSAVINASAIPGGHLYVERGFLEFVEDENEMVGAMAHEVGHVVARHTTNQIALMLRGRDLYERFRKNVLMDNDIFAEIIERLGGPVVLLAQLRYSRANESEADLLGFYEMMRAGWNPNGLIKFFERLQAKEGPRNPLDLMLSDHPATEERAAVIRHELETVKITEPMREQSLQFRALKLALSIMPPAPQPQKS